MILKAMTMQNFRGVTDEIRIGFDSLNVIVGQNDAGKSTILKALDLFFNGEEASSEILNIFASDTIVRIHLILDAQNAQIVIDENIKTTFEAEELLDESGFIHIAKTWDTEKSKITPDTFIVRKKYNQHDFLLLTEKELIKLCSQCNIETHKANGEEFNNVEKRSKLRDYHRAAGTAGEYTLEKVPTAGTSRLKQIGDALKSILPRFEYFKADTSLSESDSVIQGYFKKVTADAISSFGTQDLENELFSKLNGILTKITEKINEVVPTVERVEPDIRFDWAKLVQTTFKSKLDGGGVPLKFRGDGFRRITIMSFFEFLAENNSSEKQNIIFGIEEPETFLHPSGQEKITQKLKDLSEAGYQVIISTHSPIIVANTKLENLIHVKKGIGQYEIIQPVLQLHELVSDLGISIENQFVKHFETAHVLFLVEGKGDALFFNHSAQLYIENGLITDSFEDMKVVIIPIGGCDHLKSWVTLKLLQKLGKPFFIFFDSDKEGVDVESKNRMLLLEHGFQEGVQFHVSEKRMIENYIPPSFLNSRIPNLDISYSDWCHVKNICAKHKFGQELGGKGVVEKHFPYIEFSDLQPRFSTAGGDEFLKIYNAVRALVS